MTRDQINEDRIREALHAEAERVVPHAWARAENVRRLAAARRRRHVFVPMAAAVAVATAAVVTFGVLHRPPHPVTPPAAPVKDLDPRYRPTGPAIDAGAGVSMWFAGDSLCWRQAAGGGDCRPASERKGHAVVVGARAATYSFNGGHESQTILYGVADDDVTKVEVTGGDDARGAGQIFTEPGPGRHVWQARLAKPTTGNPARVPGTVVFSTEPSGEAVRLPADHEVAEQQALTHKNLGGATAWRSPHGRSPWTAQAPLPRPLNQGAPLFRFGSPDRADNTMHVYVDGAAVGFGSDTSAPALPGDDTGFGTLFSLTEGSDVPWWYGFMGARMTRVQARLRDGRILAADTVKIGSHHAFAVRLTRVRATAKPGTVGTLEGLDATGKVLDRVVL
ncbi:hypothetical protein J4573_23430 [Actinomadura barringtoniae]|uniref:Uncharacterized protein n=1 Tax=Actinomadura barringtoniae TaxID=1427535 RepID=A0A939PHU6_9ACTN|nr:hypothetical protein [Actinomadura barringtoniae]MBO2450074.1 hypothetical protein [Actinomadura barringtoniae]